MKKLVLVALLITGLTQSGREFLAGTVVGAGAAGGGYEYQGLPADAAVGRGL